MAGIGFLLRNLSRKNNLLGLMQAYVTSALASTGPWLFTVIALGSIMGIGSHFVSSNALEGFRVIITYNFAFSLVLSGPVCMVATRYLADAIHKRDVSSVPGMMLLALGIIYITQLPVVAAFYLLYARMSYDLAFIAITNFILISSVWLVSVFITALKNYGAVTWAFIIGMSTAVILAALLVKEYGSLGMLVSFSLGMCLITSLLMARILHEYPYLFKMPVSFLSYFTKYWEIALGGIIYNAAIWVDKWVMWSAPEANKTLEGMFVYSHYDSAMFLAYLTIVPSMAMFLFSIETNFFEHYLRFYRDIQGKASYKKIERNHYAMLSSIFSSSGSFLILQGSICIMAILLAPKIFFWLGSSYQQIGIFRYGVLGALFHVLMVFLLILLSYFDNRKAVFALQVLFLCTNALFSWITMKMGFSYYGYGYFLAAIISFIITAITVARYMLKLPYHTFVTRNQSLQ